MTITWRFWTPGLAALAAVGLVLAAPAPASRDARYKLKPGATGKTCLNCHADFEETVSLPFVHTPVKAGNCADCHDPHASDHGKLLEADPDRICMRCHDGLVPAGAASVHAPVVGGGCVKCHDPHASRHKDGLRAPVGELCASCHKDIGDAVSSATHKHVPAQRDCLGCHDPHAAAKAPALLAKAEPDLCVGCHNPALPAVAKAHGGYPVATSRCTSCHDPHGSNNAGLLWASVHPPVATRMCAQCHEPATSAAALSTRRQGSDLCRGCHNELYNDTAAKNRIHWPVVDDRACANCHTPHASRTAKLLAAPQKELCGSCHADAIARLEKSLVKHAPIVDGDCSTCHAPHASNTRFLLAADDDVTLCGTCHDWQKHSTHPIGPSVIDQRNRNVSLDCLSCHRTHGSPFKYLAHYDPKSDLCTQCHSNLAR